MLINRRYVIAMVLVTCTALATIADAQLKMPFKRRTSTASTTRSLSLTQGDGPWLVMCASFTGERGLQQAIQLANELRADHGLDAFLYKHTFDHSKKVQGSGWSIPSEQTGRPHWSKWKAMSDDVYDQVAVLVGNFPNVEDRNAKTTLQKIRQLTPRSMTNGSYAGSNQSPEQQFRAKGKGPLGAAFLMPNPILPAEYFKARNLDKIVQKMNKGVKYSLLKCPGDYSVRVATFSGEKKWNASLSDIAKAKRYFDENQRSRKIDKDSKLVDAAYKANVLCRALRKKGVMAWEFHDRHESYVCVGSYDWATDKRNDRDHLNPEIADVILEYQGITQRTHYGPRLKARTLAAFKDYDISFDVQPMPVTVPKMSVSSKRKGIGALFGR